MARFWRKCLISIGLEKLPFWATGRKSRAFFLRKTWLCLVLWFVRSSQPLQTNFLKSDTQLETPVTATELHAGNFYSDKNISEKGKICFWNLQLSHPFPFLISRCRKLFWHQLWASLPHGQKFWSETFGHSYSIDTFEYFPVG